METHLGTVAACWRYPVKSFQGAQVESLEFTRWGASGDRAWGLIDAESGSLMTAKRYSRLLEARADGEAITLPDGTELALAHPDTSAALSAWLGRTVTLARPEESPQRAYEMTFDPPNDDAEYVEIPTPAETFLDLAAAHLISNATLEGCRASRPDLNWDVRRFRPNLVLEPTGPAEAFHEQLWQSKSLRLGSVTMDVLGPTVRCAMPLRAQPGGIDRQAETFVSLCELNPEFPNHLGVYLSVTQAGTVTTGDAVTLLG
ncbi:MAG: MOSC N-terminal beta barrel domain-containing protein [Microthrixaceae bacterium]